MKVENLRRYRAAQAVNMRNSYIEMKDRSAIVVRLFRHGDDVHQIFLCPSVLIAQQHSL